MKKFFIAIAAFAATIFAVSTEADACSRILYQLGICHTVDGVPYIDQSGAEAPEQAGTGSGRLL